MKVNLAIILSLIFIYSCSSTSKKTPEEKRAEIFYNQGTSNLVNKDYTGALNNLLKAYAITPNDSKILNNLGMAYYFKKDAKLASYYLMEAIKKNKDDADPRFNLATIKMEQGELDAAQSEYEKILKILTYDKQYRTYFNMGIIELKRKDLKMAVKYFRSSIEVNKDYCPSHYELGKIAYNQKSYQLALKKFKDASNGLCFNNPEPQYMQALSMIKLRHFASANAKLTEIMERYPDTKIAKNAEIQLRVLRKHGAESDLELSQK